MLSEILCWLLTSSKLSSFDDGVPYRGIPNTMTNDKGYPFLMPELLFYLIAAATVASLHLSSKPTCPATLMDVPLDTSDVVEIATDNQPSEYA